MSRKAHDFTVFLVVVLALAICIPAVGQVLKGSISGTVLDPQGAVVPNATVTAVNIATGATYPTTTDNSGSYRLNLLPVGTYSITIEATNFKKSEAKGVAVSAGEDTGVGKLKLSVGEKSETVEVVASAPLIDTTQAQVTNTFSGDTLQNFAGIQENEGLDRLALFVPGVVATRSDNFSNTNGTGFSSNGLRGRNNDQEIDGQANNDNSVGGPGLFLSNTEFVGQYVIITNNFGPEYGRNAGSVVNVITKSGTNNWHGSVFGQDRSNFLAALSNTQKNTNKPGSAPCATPTVICNGFSGPPRFNEEFSGGAIGGPILKNKAFLFGGVDSDLFSGQNVFTTSSLTPTPAGLATLSGCAGVNATALNILKNFGPYAFGFGNPSPRNPTTTTFTGFNGAATTCPGVQVGGVTRVLGTPFHGFDFVLKNDLNFHNDTFVARYLFNRNNTFNSNDSGAAGWLINVPDLNQSTLFSWTHNISSHMVNEARVGFTRLNVQFGGGPNPLEPPPGSLLNAFTNLSFQTGSGLGLGPATNLPQARLVNTWQVQDNWNYVRGKHSFKAGVNWTYQRSPNTFLPVINGQFRFFSEAQFLMGCATCAPGGQPIQADVANRIQIAQGQPVLDFREYDTFLYAGDDWKIGQNLTLNLGVTWTYYGQPSNLFNQLTTAREANPATAFWLPLGPSVTTDPKVPGVYNSFGPSVGFAYSPQWGGFITGHGKTTIRGGYRMLYDPPFYNIFLNTSTSAPMTFLQTVSNTTLATQAQLQANPLVANPTGPNVRTALAPLLLHNTFDPRTQNETLVAPNFGPDKVQSWSLGFEREVTKNSAFEARYVGNHGYNLFQTVDGNPFTAGQIAKGLLPASTPSCATTAQSGPGAGTDLGRLACGLGVVRSRNNTGFSDYNAMQLEFRSNNLFKQLTVRAGYTWSKTLDNVSEIFATGSAGNTLFAAQNPFQTGGAERSTSGLSIPNAFTIIAIEQVPFFKSQRGAVGHILGGWTLSADYIWASGQPYTPVQAFGEALGGSPFGNVYDSAWVGAFVGTDTARPFIGSLSAPANAVGAFAHNACAESTFGCTGANALILAGLPINQVVSLNALNHTDPSTGLLAQSVVQVTNAQVRYIINGHDAQVIFGTPFGNAPRNASRDAVSNLANATIYKSIKLGERVNFQMNLTLNNAFNHFNFGSVNPTIEQAGLDHTQFFGSGFGDPSQTGANGRSVWVGGKVTF